MNGKKVLQEIPKTSVLDFCKKCDELKNVLKIWNNIKKKALKDIVEFTRCLWKRCIITIAIEFCFNFLLY